MTSNGHRKSSLARRVLLVDHREPVLETLAFELRYAGSLVKVVHTDYDAVLMARSFRPELLVTKVSMPAIGDLAEAIEIKCWNRDCKVVLLSFWDIAADAATVLTAGDFTFHLVRRPEHPAKLFDHIESIFEDRAAARVASGAA
jgi:DNA-binding response OmpR family regulator